MAMKTSAADWAPVAKTIYREHPPVSYNIKSAFIRFYSSNIGEDLERAFKSLFTQDEIGQLTKSGYEGISRLTIVFTKLEFSESEKALRISFAKQESDGCKKYELHFHGHTGTFRCSSYLSFTLGAALIEVAKTIGSERVAFADKDGSPTISPCFSLSQDSEMIVVTAPLVDMTEDSYRKQFKLAKKKPKKNS